MKCCTKSWKKRPAVIAAAAMTVLLASGRLVAQSDTAEVRPSDLPPRAEVEEPMANPFDRGKEVRANVELWEERVRNKLAAIDKMLQGPQGSLQKIEAQKIAKETLNELLDDLEDEAVAIIEAHGSVEPDLRLYRQALMQAPQVFRAMADAFDDKAEKETDLFFKEGYVDFSAAARKLADSYETRVAGLDAVERDLAAKMTFVHKGRKFTADVREFLNAVPTDYGLETEKLIKRLNAYIETFEAAVKSLKGVANKLGEEPAPAASPPQPDRISKKPPTEPLSVDGYLQRLAALRR